MDERIISFSRSTFPLSTFYLTIGNKNISLKPGQNKKVSIGSSKIDEITVSSYWIKKRANFELKNNSNIVVNHVLPDIYYIIGVSIIILLSFLTFIGIVNALILSVIVIVYYVPIMYFTFFKKEKYFKIIEE